MFARTKRLLLRPGWAEDAPALHRAWSDEAIARALPGHLAAATREDALRFLTRERDALSPWFLLFARTGGAPRLVGGCGIDGGSPGGLGGRPELAFWIARPFWGLGFATEAAGAVVRMARAAGIGPLVARPAAGNGAAGNVLRKIGFRSTGRRDGAAGSGAIAHMLFEDSGAAPVPVDSSHELYMDRAPIAA